MKWGFAVARFGNFKLKDWFISLRILLSVLSRFCISFVSKMSAQVPRSSHYTVYGIFCLNLEEKCFRRFSSPKY